MTCPLLLDRLGRAPLRIGQLALIAGLLPVAVAPAATPTDKVRFYMNVGTVEIELYGNESPLHVANFLGYLDDDAYDNSFIHRTRAFNPSQPQNYDLFVQGGSFKIPTDEFIDSNPIAQGDPVPNEFDPDNGLTNEPGSLAAARTSDPDSATSGWFINQTDNSGSFDSGPYTVYGQVTRGMEIIDVIPFLDNIPDFEGGSFESMPVYEGHLIAILRAERIPVLAGDYNDDGTVDAADYEEWKSHFGSTDDFAIDGNGDGFVNTADYTVWRDHLGQSSGAGSGAVAAQGVPEAASALLALLATMAAGFLRRRW